MQNITLGVTGMTCGHCVRAIEGSVGELSGVQKVSVSLSDKQVTIEFDPSVAQLDTIKETIQEQGYTVL